jgi:hypothetical protein
MKTIPLSKGKVAIVDDEHFAAVNQHKWTLHAKGYAYRQTRRNGKTISVLMHRFIMELAGRELGRLIDHANGDRLDNRASNLRPATPSQNGANSKLNRNNKSGYRGVSRHKDGRWVAAIKINGRKRHLGLFDTAPQAARVYDRDALAEWGEFAATNFPTIAA